MRLVAFLLCLFVCTAALAAEAVTGDSLKLDDGRIVRLTGIKAAGEAAQTALQKLIAQQDIELESPTTDRYGRIAADAYLKNGHVWLQGALLKQGLAFVYPPTGNEPHLADLLKSEKEARQAKRGIWNDPSYADRPASNPRAIPYGAFAFVSGTVVKAERVKNMVYLNFGEDWKTDFTIAIAAHDLRLFRSADIDPLTYQDKNIRVRGWVKHDFGPMITVTHPAQIELLGERAAKP